MKRIGIDVREWSREGTGTGSFLRGFLTEASRFSSGVYEFVLFGDKATSLPSGIDFEMVRLASPLTSLNDQMALPREIRRLGIDIFFSPHPKIPVFAGSKKVLSLFDLTYITFPEYRRRLKNVIYKKVLLSLYAAAADGIVTLSRTAADTIASEMGIPADKLHIVRPCVDDKMIAPPTGAVGKIMEKYGLRGRYILYVGNAKPHKNLAALCAAYASLPDGFGREFRLVLAGVGDIADRAGFDSGLAFCIDFAPADDLPALYAGDDFFVFPSICEGFGLPPVEAMACGCPVASSRSSSMPEALGDACLYFDAYDIADIRDKMLAMAEDSGLRKSLREKGLLRAGLYTPAGTAAALFEVFKSL